MDTFFIGITTFQRKTYIEQLLDSLLNSIQEKNKYIIVVNDDNSTDGTKELINSYSFPKNVDYNVLNTNNLGGHFANNNLLLFSLTKKFDFGFILDDDLIISKKGWEDLYYNSAIKTGYYHLTFYDTLWMSEKHNIVKDNLVSYSNVYDSQGAFFTFTKDMLKQIGFIDNKNFGVRGLGHIDFSIRACKMGYNNIDTFFGVNNSKNFIKLQPRETYILTPNYNETLKNEKLRTNDKKKIMLKSDRVFAHPSPSILNNIFDKIYVINLKRRPDRLEKVDKILTSLNVEYELIEAVDGKNEIDIYNEAKKRNPKLTMGVIGCHLSHLKIFKDIKKNGYKKPLIFEDDIILHKEINQLLFNLYDIDDDWDILYLGTADWDYKKNIKTYNNKTHYIGNNINSTFAYSPKPYLIEELINEFEKPISIPCDTLLHKFQNNTYVMEPKLFFVDLNGSDIREERNSEHLNRYLRQININLDNYN